MDEMQAHEAPSRATYRVQVGDIITAVSGASTGTKNHATALVTENEDGAICSNGFAVIRNVHGVDPLFLLAFFQTDFFLRQVKRKMTGHAIPCISLDELGDVLVPIPPVPEQVRIAGAVRDLQALRLEARKRLEKVSTEAHAVIESMST